MLPLRLLQYHALLRHRHELSVVSVVVVVLLHPQADGPEMSGHIALPGPTGAITVSFSFEVVRIWERSLDESLEEGGIGTLPLAPLSKVSWAHRPEVIHRIDGRLD